MGGYINVPTTDCYACIDVDGPVVTIKDMRCKYYPQTITESDATTKKICGDIHNNNELKDFSSNASDTTRINILNNKKKIGKGIEILSPSLDIGIARRRIIHSISSSSSSSYSNDCSSSTSSCVNNPSCNT